MTDHPPTMTHAELTELAETLDRLGDIIINSPDWCEPTALGLLADSDDDAIRIAAKVVRRLSHDAKHTRTSPTSYLPVPTLAPVPQSVETMTDAELYAAWRGDRIANNAYRAECMRRGWATDFGGSYLFPVTS